MLLFMLHLISGMKDKMLNAVRQPNLEINCPETARTVHAMLNVRCRCNLLIYLEVKSTFYIK
jgi:hypothetical protein